MKIYTAGPITGLSYEQVMGRYRRQVSTLEELGYKVMCPMVSKEHLKTEKEFVSGGYTHPTSTNRAIKGRDMWMVRQSDVIFVDFSGSEKVSIGSCMEIAWANMLGKHVVTVLPDNNVHKHAFVLECSDIVFPNIEDAYTYLEALIEGIN